MRKKVVSEENLKDAIASTTRALSKDPEIEITFSGAPTDSNIVLPNLPKKKSEIHSYRGIADALACSKRFSSQEIKIETGSEKINFLLSKAEDCRAEILGSKLYPGVNNNLKSRFEDKCKLASNSEDKEDLIELALEGWLRQILLNQKLSKNQLNVLSHWKESLNLHGSKFISEFKEALEDQISFSEVTRKLLHEMNLDSLENEETENEEQESNDSNDSEEPHNEPGQEELSMESTETDEIDQTEAPEDAELGDIDEDGIVDENQEINSNHSWLERLVEQTINFEYKVFTRDFDEEVNAEEMASTEELQRLRRHLDQLMGPSKSTVSKLAHSCLLYTSPSPRD